MNLLDPNIVELTLEYRLCGAILVDSRVLRLRLYLDSIDQIFLTQKIPLIHISKENQIQMQFVWPSDTADGCSE